MNSYDRNKARQRPSLSNVAVVGAGYGPGGAAAAWRDPGWLRAPMGKSSVVPWPRAARPLHANEITAHWQIAMSATKIIPLSLGLLLCLQRQGCAITDAGWPILLSFVTGGRWFGFGPGNPILPAN